MSVCRLFHWVCDNCSAEVKKPEYGLPQDWSFLIGKLEDSGQNKLYHACGKSCREALTTKL